MVWTVSNPAGRQSSLALPQQDPSNTNEGRTVEEEVLRGTVARVTYRNSENGYSVLQVDTSRYGRMTVVGTALDLSSG